MSFHVIDWDTWSRREYFEHYFQTLPCTYSMTVNLDITEIKSSGEKLYPVMLHQISQIVNRHEEFRTAIRGDGSLVVFDSMNPSYTIFHKDTETFSTIWTEYAEDYAAFKERYEADIAAYGSIHSLVAKPNEPENCFPVSMIPWAGFTGFNLNLAKGFGYLLPIFTMGKYFEKEGKTLLPLSLQVHHAVCDGFHVARFVDELQNVII